MAYKSQKNMLFKSYGKRCMLCGKKLPNSELTFHHIKPKSFSGKSTLENGAILCNTCQQTIYKYNFLSTEYFDLTLKILNNKIKFINRR